jgi:hypothetical protein
MNDLLTDLPPIVAPDDKHQPEPAMSPIAALVQQTVADMDNLKKVDLKAVALAQFGDWRGAVSAARKTLDGVAHDVSTAAKLADVVALRNRLIRTPRAEVRRVSKAVKSRLAAVSKDVGAEEDAAVAAYDDAEALITPQIDAGQQKLDEERLERERLAAERAQKITDELAEISTFLDRARTTEGMTAERVGKGIAILAAMTFCPDDWIDPAAAAKVQLQTIAGMHELQAKLAAEEAAAAQMEALRLANERMAAQLAAQQAALDAQAAALRAEQNRITGLKARIAEIHAAATGHDSATAADLYEAMVAVTALDVSEAQYQEYTALAMAAQDATLATLQDLHFKAVEREEAIEAVRQRAVTPAANVATAAATEGKADTPEPGTLEAAPELLAQDQCAGLSRALAADPAAPLHAREAAASIATEPMPQPGVAPQDHPLPEADAAPGMGTAGPAMTHAAFLALVMTAFDCKFPSHPKPSQEWWAKVRAAGQALQQQGL